MSVLDEIIDGATNDSVSTSNLLRKVQIVAHRLKATAIEAWVRQELNGYEDVEHLPKYRADLVVNVMGVWAGPMGARDQQPLSAGVIPEDAKQVLFRLNLNQSLAELEELANSSGDGTLGMPWDQMHVIQYNRWAEEGKVPHIAYMNLYSANRVVSQAMLRGVIDAIRNAALDFALELQDASPEAGTVGGPTISDEAVSGTIMNITNNIYGDGAQVAQGKKIHQHSEVQKGDLAALLQAVKDAGLGQEGERELAKIVLMEEADRPNRLSAFFQKVRDGGFAIATGASGDLLAESIQNLVKGYLGG